ncbi:PAS domain S-box protein [Staphylococcus condimenti]|uniref:DUF438 domain-containing protein n=3 Tax=Staphylococcus condimenti TaxID=70255 RepID=A0AB37GXB2_9STAP|nr:MULTISPECIES: PAS domain-containing protein [Staphylococcus]AMY06550.1 PAS domain S-box protein [Staphylococcus condimenti]APR60431.1 PAS domain S-box protein [Staphylococcus condimenti]MDK8645935.1 PAS domain-containing protein [Staphylococcus condimenti]OFP00592.1 PAS domain S-box protein [Staphylococcus sp. HMSC065E08]PNZ62209.1 PAS domain S-box protein [Staphylococcus condimenti]
MFNISSVSNEIKEEAKGLIDQNNHQEDIQDSLKQFIQNVSNEEVLEALRQLYYIEKFATIDDIANFIIKLNKVTENQLTKVTLSEDAAHPINIFTKEIEYLEGLVSETGQLLKEVEMENTDAIKSLKDRVASLNGLIAHFNRKEKILFPVLERRGIYILPRKMWADDDIIRNYLKRLQKRIEKIGEIEWRHVETAFVEFEAVFIEMLKQERLLLVPLMQDQISPVEWAQIAAESKAFGYAIKVSKVWDDPEIEPQSIDAELDAKKGKQNLRFGGGYLTTKEADLILDNLPVEITFVDKNGVFKYFNDLVESSEMMFIRTPISIGRNVANCHPPKSLSKVMAIIRDLKTKQRESESMWFKKGDKFIYVTYKALFDENDEYVGILEYVQDIQPFFNLPQRMKRNAENK